MSLCNAYHFKMASDLIHTAGLLSEEQLAELGREGYSLVVNLLPNEHEYAVGNEQELVESQGIEYCYIPVDFSNSCDSD